MNILKKLTNQKKNNNTNNQKIQELENYFNDYEENKIETEKKKIK